MRLKEQIYYYENIRVIIIGRHKKYKTIVLVSPIKDNKCMLFSELSDFHRELYDIKDIYKNRKYVYGIKQEKLLKA